MGKFLRLLMLSAAFELGLGNGQSFAEDPVLSSAKAAFESIGRGKPVDGKPVSSKPIDSKPIVSYPVASKPVDHGIVLVAGKACQSGNCPAAAPVEVKEAQPIISKPKVMEKLFSNHAASCECKPGPTPYRPPLYAWFPCKPGACGIDGACARPTQTVAAAPVPQTKPREPMVRMPDPPRLGNPENTLVSGSSSAMAANVEPAKPVSNKKVPALLNADKAGVSNR